MHLILDAQLLEVGPRTDPDALRSKAEMNYGLNKECCDLPNNRTWTHVPTCGEERILLCNTCGWDCS